jgi:DNA-binding transcriptional regulator YhcF (GntR family)
MTRQPEQGGLDLSEFAIDRDADVPIGVQLAWTLRTHIQDGRCRSGERLPGLRELAEAIGVNINTVKAVYQRLDKEGLIDTQQGSGTFVSPAARTPTGVAAIVAYAVREARETGVDPREVAAALYVSPEPQKLSDAEADRRRLLRTQIAALERALGDIEAEHPGVAPLPVESGRSAGPRLLGAEQLEQVRTQLVRRLTTVQAAIDEQAQTESDPPIAEKRRRSAERSSSTTPKRTPRPRATPRAAPANG